MNHAPKTTMMPTGIIAIQNWLMKRSSWLGIGQTLTTPPGIFAICGSTCKKLFSPNGNEGGDCIWNDRPPPPSRGTRPSNRKNVPPPGPKSAFVKTRIDPSAWSASPRAYIWRCPFLSTPMTAT